MTPWGQMAQENPNSTRLWLLIQQLIHDRISAQELNELSSLLIQSTAIALKLRQRNHTELVKRINQNNIYIIAKECVAPMLTAPHLASLARYIKKSSSDQDPVLCMAAVYKAVNKRITQYLWEIFKETHDSEAKLMRNLRLAIKNRPDMKREKEYVIFVLQQRQYTIVPWPMLERTLTAIYKESQDMRQLLSALREELLACYNSSVAVDLFDLAGLVGKLMRPAPESRKVGKTAKTGPIAEPHVTKIQAAQQNSHAEFALQYAEFFQYGLKSLHKIDRIVTGYVRNNKVSLAQGQIIRQALQELFNDLLTGNSAESNLCYLKRYDISLTHEEYTTTLRTRFEYLAGIIRKHLQKGYHKFF